MRTAANLFEDRSNKRPSPESAVIAAPSQQQQTFESSTIRFQYSTSNPSPANKQFMDYNPSHGLQIGLALLAVLFATMLYLVYRARCRRRSERLLDAAIARSRLNSTALLNFLSLPQAPHPPPPQQQQQQQVAPQLPVTASSNGVVTRTDRAENWLLLQQLHGGLPGGYTGRLCLSNLNLPSQDSMLGLKPAQRSLMQQQVSGGSRHRSLDLASVAEEARNHSVSLPIKSPKAAWNEN